MANVSKITVNGNDYDIKDTEARSGLSNKQDTLVSGTNIKTVNGNSLLGSGDLTVGGSVDIDNETITKNNDNELQVVSIKNKRDDSTLGIWHGTEYQWNHGDPITWYCWRKNITAMWTTSTTPSSEEWSSIAYGDGKFVVSNRKSDKITYSTDCINWTEITLPSSVKVGNIAYGDGKFVTVDYGSDKAAYSTDGINWTTSAMPSSKNWYSIAYGDGKFIAATISNSNKAAYSTDGINWIETTMPSSTDWVSITYGDGKFIAMDSNSNKAAYSTDGINWIETTMPSSLTWQSVAYGDGKFVAVAYNTNKAAYSTDGINWIETTMPSSAYWQSVAYGDGKFVTVANATSNNSAYSTDGINWIKTTTPSSMRLTHVAYGDGKFVVPSRGSAAIFTQYDNCYTDTANPTTTSVVYSAPETASSYTISSVTSGAITLSNNNTYYYTQSGNTFTYRTIGDVHPEYLTFIDGVGIKKGNTLIASATPITTTITSSSTDTEAPSAKAVYDEIGDVESALNTINSGS